MTHPRGRDDQRRPRGRPDVPTDYNPRSNHPSARQAFAACDLHLPEMLRLAHYEQRTLRWRISHIETPDPTYICQCHIPAHWFLLELPSPTEEEIPHGN